MLHKVKFIEHDCAFSGEWTATDIQVYGTCTGMSQNIAFSLEKQPAVTDVGLGDVCGSEVSFCETYGIPRSERFETKCANLMLIAVCSGFCLRGGV